MLVVGLMGVPQPHPLRELLEWDPLPWEKETMAKVVRAKAWAKARAKARAEARAEDKAKIEGQIKALKDAVAAEDYDQMKSLTTELQQTLYSISANLYQAAAGPEGSTGPSDSAGASGGDDVIDAEFTEDGK